MTAKRFVKTHKTINWWAILDNGKELLEDEVVELLNELHEEKEQLLSDKEHLMGYLIRFRSFDDEDLDYVMNRESNREYGKQYYEMKEEDW